MANEYAAWLSSLGQRRADMPVTDRLLPVAHTVTYPGNVTTATLYGAVKSAPDSTAELAVFTIGTPSFDAGTNRTSWLVTLSGTQTGTLPADGNQDGVAEFVYDFLLTLSGGVPERIFGGLFPVAGFVSEPA
jgi:hypothetical protein